MAPPLMYIQIALIIVFWAVVSRYIFEFSKENIPLPHGKSYIETELKFIKTENPIKIFENSVSKCVMKDFNENIETGSYITGYYSYNDPTRCLSKDQFLEMTNNGRNIECILQFTASFLFSVFITLIFALFTDHIRITYHKHIYDFFEFFYKIIVYIDRIISDDSLNCKIGNMNDDLLDLEIQSLEKKLEQRKKLRGEGLNDVKKD